VIDRGLIRNQQFDYYIVPEDPFENVGPESATATIYAVNFSRLPLPQRVRAVGDPGGIRVIWTTEGNDLVLSTRIYRSPYFDSGYVKIAEVPAAQSMYYDQGMEGMTRYYYRLSNVTYRNHESQKSAAAFGFWKSPLPPATPQGVEAKPVKGGVKITWAANRDADLAGYLVCRAKTTKDTLLPISPLLRETHFTDTSSTLNASLRYRYAVIAVNSSQNKSLPSIDAWAKPRIATFPPPPRSLFASVRNNGIWLNWSDSREDDETVVGYGIYRAIAGKAEQKFTLLKRVLYKFDNTAFFDTTAVPGQKYHYAVTSLNAAGGEGVRSRGVEATIALDLPPAPADLHAQTKDASVLLEWENMEDEDIASFIVYRSETGGTPRKIATVKMPSHDFTDSKVKKGVVYYYSIASVNTAGREGEASKPVYAAP
jgi:fibronectin type 3 domain-containing protein